MLRGEKKGSGGKTPKHFRGTNFSSRKDKTILSITEAAKLVGVTNQTMREYDNEGVLKPDFTTERGHRRYKLETLKRFTAKRNATNNKFSENLQANPPKHVVKSKVWKGDGKYFQTPVLSELTEDQIAAMWVNKGGENTRIPLDHPSEFAIACSLCGLSDKKAALRFGVKGGELRRMWFYVYKQDAPQDLWLELSAIWKRIINGRILTTDPLSAALTSGAVDRMSGMALMVDEDD